MILSNDELAYVVIFCASFTVTFLIIPWLIPRLKSRNIVGIDMNKPDKPEVPEIGGVSVVMGVFIGIYLQIVIYDIYRIGFEPTNFLLVSVMAIIGIAFIGILDDLLGMRQSIKAFLPFLFALPLGVFVSETMTIPFLGDVNFSYAILFLVPFGVTCAANSMNMLEGFNGLGTGLGIIITITLIILSFMKGNFQGLFLLVPLLGSLLAFFYYNNYPASIFPGDTLTLFMGGVIGCAAMQGLKFEGAVLMLPMIVEFFLKLRGNFKGQCFATSFDKDILIFDGKIESLTHLVMNNFEVTEKKLVRIFWLFEIFLSIVVVLLSHYSLI